MATLAAATALAIAFGSGLAAAQVSPPRAPGGLGGSLGLEGGGIVRPKRDVPAVQPVLPPAPAPSSTDAPAGPEIQVRSEFTDTRGRIVLVWPAAPKAEWSIEGREVVLRLDREVNAPALAELQEKAGDWLEAVNFGYDSILVRTARDAILTVEQQGREIRIAMVLEEKPPEPDARAAKAQARRLKLIEIDLLSRTGKLFEARREAAALLADDPTQIPTILLLAEIEQRLDNWQRALELYDDALLRSPGNPDVVQAQAAIRRERGGELRQDIARQVVSGADTQRSVRKRGRAHPALRTEMGFEYEVRDLSTPTVRRLDGLEGPFFGIRQRGEVYLSQRLDDPALSVRGTLFGSHATVGGGAKVEANHDNARTWGALEWHRPYWEFVEALVSGGHRDRVELGHSRPLDEEQLFNVGLTLAVNRYGVRDADDVAASATPLVEFSWAILPTRPNLTFLYNLDAEYRLARQDRAGPGNAPFSPIPLPSREVHSFVLALSGNLTDYLRASGYGGYARDRLNVNSKGPRFGGELAYEPVSDFEVGLNYLYSKASGRGSGSIVNRYGLYATGRF